MKLFWITSDTIPFGWGVGVTAYDRSDAIGLAEAAGAVVLSVKQIYSLDELEQDHVRLNLGNHMKRGIWFPQFFDHIE